MQLTHDIIYYFGMALGILGIILLWFFTSQATKNKENKIELKENLKKSGLYWVAGAASLLISFIFFDVAFFINPETTKYLAESKIEITAGRQFLSYFFVIIDSLAISVIVLALYYRSAFKGINKKLDKIALITWIVCLPLIIVSTVLFLEGNAPYFQYPLANSIHFGKDGIKILAIHNGLLRDGTAASGMNIAFYAIAILSGACVVLIICDYICNKRYGKHGLLTTCFLIAVPCGIVGARLWYVILDLTKEGTNSQFFTDPVNIFRIWNGGLGIMGGAVLGIIGGVTVMIVLCKVLKKPVYKEMSLLYLIDFIVPCILVAQAIGRWGNFFNCEVFGDPVNEKYFMFLPTWIRNNMKFEFGVAEQDMTGQIYLPLFFIEGLVNITGYLLIYFGFCKQLISKGIIKLINLASKDEKIIKADSYHAPGTCAGMYLFWYGMTRLILEPLRNGQDKFQASINTSIALMSIGAAVIVGFILYYEIYTKRIRANKILAMVDNNIDSQPAENEENKEN